MDNALVPVYKEEQEKSEQSLLIEPELSSLNVGDMTKVGDVIEYIYHRSDSIIIYRNTAGYISYLTRGDFSKYKPAFVEFHKLIIEAEKQLRGAYRRDFSNLIAVSLRSALFTEDGENIESYFTPIRKFIEEKGPIESIYGWGSGFLIYLNKQRFINYEYRELPNRLLPALAEFHRLQHIARASLQETDKNEVASLLGNELAAVFRATEDSDPSSFFVSSKEFITNRSEAILRSKYIRASVFSSFLLLLLLAPVCYYLKITANDFWVIPLGGLGGVIGATISLIQRGGALTVNPFVPVSHVVFQGLVRVLLGVIFGALLVVASQANITLGIISNNIWSLFIFSVVAGFSERLVPDILERIATQSDSRENRRTT
jgi:hypothetical protein